MNWQTEGVRCPRLEAAGCSQHQQPCRRRGMRGDQLGTWISVSSLSCDLQTTAPNVVIEMIKPVYQRDDFFNSKHLFSNLKIQIRYCDLKKSKAFLKMIYWAQTHPKQYFQSHTITYQFTIFGHYILRHFVQFGNIFNAEPLASTDLATLSIPNLMQQNVETEGCSSSSVMWDKSS